MKQASRIAMLAVIIQFALGFGPAVANDDPMELTMTVEEEIESVDAQGNHHVELIAAEEIIPGDTVVYTTQYHYRGDQVAENIAITNIIPVEVTYLPGSAAGSDAVTFSVDGGKRFATPDELTMIDSTGETRPATAKDYTHIRWRLPELSGGQTGSVSFKTKVNEE